MQTDEIYKKEVVRWIFYINLFIFVLLPTFAIDFNYNIDIWENQIGYSIISHNVIYVIFPQIKNHYWCTIRNSQNLIEWQ